MDTCACVNTRTSTAQRQSSMPTLTTPTVSDSLELTCDFNSSIDMHCLDGMETVQVTLLRKILASSS